MKLWALSDLHLRYPKNRAALEALPAHPEDWLILAGDLGEKEEHLEFCFSTLTGRFAKLIWVPGNHELWTEGESRGQARYQALVALARRHGVLTPEDPFPVWQGRGGPCVIAPLFVLYDYSFRPPEVSRAGALAWAAESGILCTDEHKLAAAPFPSRDAWCAHRVVVSEQRLAAIDPALPTVLINHFPLRQDLVRLRRIPRFSLWCGTKATEDWHRRYRAKVVVCGHLHIRTTDWIDGVRFEEVGVGYPRQWRQGAGWRRYLREILPGPFARPVVGEGARAGGGGFSGLTMGTTTWWP